jgi:hypothetical protein
LGAGFLAGDAFFFSAFFIAGMVPLSHSFVSKFSCELLRCAPQSLRATASEDLAELRRETLRAKEPPGMTTGELDEPLTEPSR